MSEGGRDRKGSADPPFGVAPRTYRLPENTRVGMVRLQVSDLERSLAWYGRILGLEATDEGRGRAVLAAGGVPLVELHEHAEARSVRGRPRLGLFHFAILLPDRPALGRFVAHVGALGERVGAADHHVSEALYLHDPDGLGVEVYVDRPRSVWRTREPGPQGPTRELVMTTEPLDVPGLVEDAAGAAWDGMPAGTVIGHVHLHVGDLERAAGFYHEGLGFDKVVWSYPGALFLSAGGYHHHLAVNTWAGSAPVAGPDDARLLEWELLLPSPADARALGEHLGPASHEGPRTEPDASGSGPGLLLHDPWGTAVRIRTPPSAGEAPADGEAAATDTAPGAEDAPEADAAA